MEPNKKENIAIISLGSNLGNGLKNLDKAKVMLCSYGEIIKESSVYLTEPWGNKDQPQFFNQAIVFLTSLPAVELMQELLTIEMNSGRKRGIKWQARIIDLDILFYNDEIFKQDEITIPHPRIEERNFILTMLEEIVPALVHPVLKKNVLQLKAECKDMGQVIKF